MNPIEALDTFRLPQHWTPEQALAIHELLDALQTALWLSYGDEFAALIAEKRADSPQLDLDFDDPLPF